MYLTVKDHAKRISELCDLKPHSVFLSTYGMYAGLLETGWDASARHGKNDCRELLDRLAADSVKTEIIVGIPKYFSCTAPDSCENCEGRYIKQLVRLLVHAEHFDSFKWLYTSENHLKCSIFAYDDQILGVTGGRNLTGSNWDDITFDLTDEQCQEMLVCYGKCKRRCMQVDSKNIQHTMETFKSDTL